MYTVVREIFGDNFLAAKMKCAKNFCTFNVLLNFRYVVKIKCANISANKICVKISRSAVLVV